MNDYEYMKKALKEAEKAYEQNEVPVGAVIVQNKKIIAKAFNQKEIKKCCLYHAEIAAIKQATRKNKNWRLNDCILYVTLEPCPMCASAIKQSRIKKIVYLCENSNVENRKIADMILKSKDSNLPVEKVKMNVSIFSKDEQEILKKFFKQKRI